MLENVVFHSEQLLLVRVTEIPRDLNYPGLPHIISVHVQYTFATFFNFVFCEVAFVFADLSLRVGHKKDSSGWEPPTEFNLGVWPALVAWSLK